LAEALTLRGSHDAALAAVKDGQKAQDETGQRTWEAELHHLEAVALFGLNRLAESQSAFEKALGGSVAILTTIKLPYSHIRFQHLPALEEPWHRAHPRCRNECVYTAHV